MNQCEIFGEEISLTTDMHVLLQLFINWMGHDIPQNFFDLSHVYHSVHTHPGKLPKSSWSKARVLKAIEVCENAGLIVCAEYNTGEKWTITEKGMVARRSAELNAGLKRRSA